MGTGELTVALGFSLSKLSRGRWASQTQCQVLSPSPSVSVMGHCRRRGSQLLLGQECHLHVYEQGGVAQVRTWHCSSGPLGILQPARVLRWDLLSLHGSRTCRGDTGRIREAGRGGGRENRVPDLPHGGSKGL
jgi:hypothetical protein